MRRFFLGGLLTVCLHAQPTLYFEGRYWQTQLGSRFRVDRNGIGTDIDVVKDLGFEDKGFPEGKFTLQATEGTGSAFHTRQSIFPAIKPFPARSYSTANRSLSARK